jgi:hypothetical protein
MPTIIGSTKLSKVIHSNNGTSKNGGWGHVDPLPMSLTWGCQRLVRSGFAIVFRIKKTKKGEWGMCTHTLETRAQTSSEFYMPQHEHFGSIMNDEI